jgi:S-(hydroxymethyl)glutathione dehydrogenase/alcohol dehydrogenase
VFSGAVGKDAVLQLPANDLHTSNKRIIGTVYGGAQVRRDIPRLVALAEAGRIDLDRMITKRFSLDEANAALTVMEGGDVIRSVLIP